ncbi:predicted protein [Plenodomus lingam JN3]|uniref:Predicted protein n=1 Tax=Leptosphaeria maculans (strain JN3 / isolate v23.1.3 / race Av1-4-5-6-7-8) TaxID=985895 RepID=E5AAA6_LEPMJ|nr:predicted protein [Plenodomus lingam JN3]CBY00597.1 predicted protein [Plenodomus lingam JN3]
MPVATVRSMTPSPPDKKHLLNNHPTHLLQPHSHLPASSPVTPAHPKAANAYPSAPHDWSTCIPSAPSTTATCDLLACLLACSVYSVCGVCDY